MTDNIDKDVLMKCENCGYKEMVSLKELETIRNLPPVSKEDKILCPFCLHYMYKIEKLKDKQ